MDVQFQRKQLGIFLAVFQVNHIIINHPYGPSLTSNVHKNGPQIFNETRQVRGV